ncbi:MAG: RHS domain-containing protein [Thermoanaerobaculia bacterium]
MTPLPRRNNNRAFTYQDIQYFLASAAGPWPGPLAWTFDKIGNRLSETSGDLTDSYTYGTNTAGGHSPILQQITLGAAELGIYTFGPAGHLAEINAAGNRVTVTHDEAGQLGQFSRLTATVHSDFLYDGRGFSPTPKLYHISATALEPALAPRGVPGTPIFADGFESGGVCAWAANFGTITPPPNCPPATPAPFVNPTYSSSGLLYSLTRDNAPSEVLYFPFAGRPVAQLTIDGDNETYQWITTDHLGTPIALTNSTGALLWQGGFEPYGKDYSGATAQNLYLRLPGQWEEETWAESGLGVGAFYNVHRWYESGAGRYGEVDPLERLNLAAGPLREFLGLPRLQGSQQLYGYVDNRPTADTDTSGLGGLTIDCGNGCTVRIERDPHKGLHANWECKGGLKGCIRPDGSLCEASKYPGTPPDRVLRCIRRSDKRFLREPLRFECGPLPEPPPATIVIPALVVLTCALCPECCLVVLAVP